MRNRLEQYLQVLAGRCAPLTVKRVRVVLDGFISWLWERGLTQWYELTPEHVRGWASWKAGSVRPATLFYYKREVRALLQWLYRGEYLLVNPWDETLDCKRLPYNPRRTPTVAQAGDVLEQVGRGEGRCIARDRAILELAYSSGLRRKEIQRLNLADIREDWLRVRGKGDRERLVPLGWHAKQWLLRYIGRERTRAAQLRTGREPALFLTWYGTRLGTDAYGSILKRWGLTHICTLHGLRHACATHMLRNGADIRLLQRLLGHRKLSSTQIYTRVDRTDLARMLAERHPRG
jgi:integrase/recombinase XerD